jgi:hypothetical protein
MESLQWQVRVTHSQAYGASTLNMKNGNKVNM